MRQFRMAQLVVLGAFIVSVGSATVRMSQMIDWDEPWHGGIAHYTDFVAQYPAINVLAALYGVFLLVSAIAVVAGVLCAATPRWRGSRRAMVAAGIALGLAGLAVGGWGMLIAVLAHQIEWSAVVGTLAGGCAVLAAVNGPRTGRPAERAGGQSAAAQVGGRLSDGGDQLRTLNPTRVRALRSW